MFNIIFEAVETFMEPLELTLSQLGKMQKIKFLGILSKEMDFLLFPSTRRCQIKWLQKSFGGFKNDVERIWRLL